MVNIFVIKTNNDNVVTEYHEYQHSAAMSWKPSPDHLLVEKPEVDPVGHVYTAGGCRRSQKSSRRALNLNLTRASSS